MPIGSTRSHFSGFTFNSVDIVILIAQTHQLQEIEGDIFKWRGSFCLSSSVVPQVPSVFRILVISEQECSMQKFLAQAFCSLVGRLKSWFLIATTYKDLDALFWTRHCQKVGLIWKLRWSQGIILQMKLSETKMLTHCEPCAWAIGRRFGGDYCVPAVECTAVGSILKFGGCVIFPTHLSSHFGGGGLLSGSKQVARMICILRF